MATHTVKGNIVYPFEVEVELPDGAAQGLSVEALLEMVEARDAHHFGRLALDGDDIWILDDRVTVEVTEVVPGGIIWESGEEPATGMADGSGGIVWDS